MEGDMRAFRIVLFILVALVLTTMTAGTALGGVRLVDERAVLTLTPGVQGVAGTVDIRLRIRDVGLLDLFRARLDATGLTPGSTYNMFLGADLIATGTADATGRVTIDQILPAFAGTTLVGLDVRVTSVDTGVTVLSGTITQTNLVPDVAPVALP
jgi:hypothetical protein